MRKSEEIEGEEWKPIKGYEGLYEVSNLKRVRSLDRTDRRGCFYEGKLLKEYIGNKGNIDKSVTLSKNGKTKRIAREELYKIAFGGEQNGKTI